MRDEFSSKTREQLEKRVNGLCSNPGCQQPTSGPQDDPTKSINVGVAAHITAASPGFARYNPNLTSEQRSSADNGIWLCQTCAKMVDNDEVHYDYRRLINWKRGAEEAARRALEERTAKPGDVPTFGFDESALRFIEPIGVWFDTDASLYVCPRCKSDGKRNYLKNEERGFRCTACGGYFSDPSRQRSDPAPSYRPSRNSWMG